jgi:hypothetical protein
MVGVAQQVERLVVVQDVAGSSPVTHPEFGGPALLGCPDCRDPMTAPLAQLAEQLTLNQRVGGSIPSRRTNVMSRDIVNTCSAS